MAADLTIYSDGSCLGGKRGCPSGWAFVVVQAGRVVFERNGSVDPGLVDSDHPHRVGCQWTSNNAAELQAFVELALWLWCELSSSAFSATRSVEWVYDSEWCHDVACGTCTSRVHPEAVKLAQALLVALVRRLRVYGRWVKGHSGDRWNDRVDTLAKDGAKRRLLTHRGAVRAESVLALREGLGLALGAPALDL